jgi:hypothetical protein
MFANSTLPNLYGMICLLWWIVLAISLIVLFALKFRFYCTLRDKFPDIWQELGRPTLFLNNSITNRSAVRRFLRQRAYEKTEDEEFIRCCTTLRRFQLAYFIFFFSGILLILIIMVNR